MALSAASCLHYWSSRYGHVPVIGGKPVHSRASTARLIDIASQQVVEVPAATPRDTHLITIDGEERAALLLEMARTNICLRSQELDSATWTKTSLVTVTANAAPAPDGTLTADKVVSTGNSDLDQTIGVTASTAYVASFYVRNNGGTLAVYRIYNATAGTDIVAATSFLSQINGLTWTRISVPFTTPAGCISVRLMLHSGVSGLNAFFWGVQLEQASVASSYISTGASAVTRFADSFYWDYTPAPQGMMAYVRFIESGTVSAAGRIIHIGNAGGSGAQYMIYVAAGYYTAYHHNGTSVVTSTLAAAPSIGATVELIALMDTDGTVQIIQSINGGAVTYGARSAALAPPSAWGDTRLWANSQGTSGLGAVWLAELKLVKYTDVASLTESGRMDELRGFEHGPNRELLSAA